MPEPAGQLGLFGSNHPAAGLPVIPTGKRETSLRAAHVQSRTGNARSNERRVYDRLGESPCTDDELCNALGLDGNSVRPRRRSLVQRGLVRDSEARRPSSSGNPATVWEVVKPWA